MTETGLQNFKMYLIVKLPEPSNQCKSFATCNRHYLVKGVGSEGHQQSGFTEKTKALRCVRARPLLVVKRERAATKAIRLRLK